MQLAGDHGGKVILISTVFFALALTGGLIRRCYVTEYDRIVAVFSTSNITKSENGCRAGGHIYKYYDVNFEPDGREGVLNCKLGDSAELFVGNILYDVSMATVGNGQGCDIGKYDAVTWTQLGEIQYSVNPDMNTNDMSIELVNGLLDVSSLYGRPGENVATRHNFFIMGLQFVNQKIFSETENTNGSSTL